MGLVRDDDDVRAVGELWVLLALGRHELLDRGEDNAARGHLQLLLQVVAVLGLHRLLPQQVFAGRERAEQLVVQVIAVCQHQERRVVHHVVPDDLPRVEYHRQRLPRPLRVPDDPHAAVAVW